MVVTLQDPPENLRPGTLDDGEDHDGDASRHVLTDSDSGSDGSAERRIWSKPKAGKSAVQAAARRRVERKQMQTRKKFRAYSSSATAKPNFVPVETGITGTTDIEVLNGLKEGDEIVTGSYKVLRTMKPDTRVKIDNTAPKKEEERV